MINPLYYCDFDIFRTNFLQLKTILLDLLVKSSPELKNEYIQFVRDLGVLGSSDLSVVIDRYKNKKEKIFLKHFNQTGNNLCCRILNAEQILINIRSHSDNPPAIPALYY
ncbi:hypothetical protein MHBO_000700 [Bonamia ostreae]|uniref:LAGLIDADG homing endonuclease n=1 Tax=Bonamia ostreae TaxID=126728 RepID=A0ABV2AGK2_9EUKA